MIKLKTLFKEQLSSKEEIDVSHERINIDNQLKNHLDPIPHESESSLEKVQHKAHVHPAIKDGKLAGFDLEIKGKKYPITFNVGIELEKHHGDLNFSLNFGTGIIIPTLNKKNQLKRKKF